MVRSDRRKIGGPVRGPIREKGHRVRPKCVKRPGPFVALAFLILVSPSTGLVSAQDSSYALVRGGRVAVVLPESLSTEEEMAVEDLSSFLQRSLHSVVRQYPGSVRPGA